MALIEFRRHATPAAGARGARTWHALAHTVVASAVVVAIVVGGFALIDVLTTFAASRPQVAAVDRTGAPAKAVRHHAE